VAAHRVGAAGSIPDGGRQIVEIAGRSIGVFNLGGEFVALRNRCPHQGGPTCEGEVLQAFKAYIDERGRVVEFYDKDQQVIACPWHGVEFDLHTGVCLADPDTRIKTYPVTIADGSILVEVDA
jgi:3-phenylpropionate/trans-cinnamate dioxygenase ferredoxin subunit